MGLEEPLVRTTAHQRRKKGAKVGRQAHTMPMKGSTQDQTKTGDMVQVGSDDLTLFSSVTMRTTLAMQTLEWLVSLAELLLGGVGDWGKMDSQAS